MRTTTKIPTKAELEMIRAEFAALPNVVGVEVYVRTTVEVRTKTTDFEFGKLSPIYEKEIEMYDMFPEVLFGFVIEDCSRGLLS